MSPDNHRQGQRVPLASPFPSRSNINYLALKKGGGIRSWHKGKQEFGRFIQEVRVSTLTWEGRSRIQRERRFLGHRKGTSSWFGVWSSRRLQAGCPCPTPHCEGTPVYLQGLLFA
jgi:hypothetical protein